MNPPVDKNKKALGRGLESLLGAAPGAARLQPAAAELEVQLDHIVPNPHQPRRDFPDAALAELAASIRSHGVLQPVLVRPAAGSDGHYELIAGERRWRAAQLAGLTRIPARVRPVADARLLEVALIENIQREDLNPIEQAQAFLELVERLHLTHDEIAERTGKERATISNSLRLLKLSPFIQNALAAGKMSMGQARPLIGLDPAQQERLAGEILSHGLTARQVEQRVSQLTGPRPAPRPPKPVDANRAEAEQQLTRALGARVRIQVDRRQRGSIVISFAGLDDFQRLYERLAPS